MPNTLFSFRRCPYAIRTRVTLLYTRVSFDLIEVDLKNKPEQLLSISSKATVPVLKTDDTIIDESLDIMLWALKQNDPDNWLLSSPDLKPKIMHLIDENDNYFKKHLDHYKYPIRYVQPDEEENLKTQSLKQCAVYLQKLVCVLGKKNYLFGHNISIADIAIFPFVRQFHNVDKDILKKEEFINLYNWLQRLLDYPHFIEAMKKNTS